MTEDLDLLTTDEAVVSAMTPKSFADIELKPFSLMRQVVALELFGPSSGHYFNAIMTVWICTLEPKEILEARKDPEQAQSAALAWAEQRGISIVNIDPILDLYTQLNKELEVTAKVQLKDRSAVPKNAGGLPV